MIKLMLLFACYTVLPILFEKLSNKCCIKIHYDYIIFALMFVHV